MACAARFAVTGRPDMIEGDFGRGLPEAGGGLADIDRALDLDDGGDEGLPFRFRDGGRGVEHRDGSGFVAVAPFLVHCPHARLGLGRGADGLDFLTEDRLVLFELDDQMRVGDGGGFESFFWQCMASQVTIWPAKSSSSISFCTAGISLDLSSISMWARTSAVSTANAVSTCLALASLKLSKLPFSVLPSNAMTRVWAPAGARFKFAACSRKTFSTSAGLSPCKI